LFTHVLGIDLQGALLQFEEGRSGVGTSYPREETRTSQGIANRARALGVHTAMLVASRKSSISCRSCNVCRTRTTGFAVIMFHEQTDLIEVVPRG
jgi:hypothetical protein